jgi:hypothetical protein
VAADECCSADVVSVSPTRACPNPPGSDILAQKFVTPDPEKGYDLARTLRLGEC